MDSQESAINVVLIEPEIPQNTGNIGRTCVGVGATLHLVGELGFSIEGKEIKRAGLDYWPNLKLVRHKNWKAFLESVPKDSDLCYFSTRGKISFWERKYKTPLYLIFGSESRGFPASIYNKEAGRLVRIPANSKIRSLNLATAVGVAIYEVLRQLKGN